MVVDLEPGDVLYVPPYWFHLAMTRPFWEVQEVEEEEEVKALLIA